MKKIVKLFAAIALITPFFFTACDNPAFDGVINDVVSEDATVSGSITHIARYNASGTEFLILNADGGMRYKRADNRSHGSWQTYGALPFSLHSYDYYGEKHNGEQIIKIVADSEYLYILSCTYKNDNDAGTVAPDLLRLRCAKIKSTNGTTLDAANWTLLNESKSGDLNAIFKIYKYSTTEYYYSAFCLFSTNAVNPEHRKVYIRSGKHQAVNSENKAAILTTKYYELTPDSTTKLKEFKPQYAWYGNTKVTDLDANLLTRNIQSVAWYNNEYVFFINPTAVTNEYYNSTTKAYVNPTFIYYGDGYGKTSSLCWLKEGAFGGTISTSRSVSAIAVCSDAIIIGMGTTDPSTGVSTYGGITKSNLKDGVPQGTSSFKTNAESQITSGYHVYALLNANPAEAELASALYAAIGIAGTGSSTGVAYSSIGLWSYYPARGNWNRE